MEVVRVELRGGIPSFLVQREESLNDNYPTAGSKSEGCRR
jgi:hypothetical protein